MCLKNMIENEDAPVVLSIQVSDDRRGDAIEANAGRRSAAKAFLRVREDCLVPVQREFVCHLYFEGG